MATILVVEDNDDVREMMAVTLELEGHHAVTAANGREALDMLRRGLEPSLILLDLMMPVMNGFQFREEQRGDPALADIPVVVITADVNARSKAEGLGAAGFIQKPVKIQPLLDMIEQHLRR